MLTLLFLPSPISASAHSASTTYTTTPTTGLTFRVNIGFDARYRDGTWVPVHITLSNNGPDFHGMLSIDPPPLVTASGAQSPSSYQVQISLANGVQKQVTLYVPLSSGVQGATQNITT